MNEDDIFHVASSMYWPRSIEIRQKFGFEGYGIFWALQELEVLWNGIYMGNLELFAYELRTKESKLKSIIDFMVQQQYWSITDEGLVLINRKG